MIQVTETENTLRPDLVEYKNRNILVRELRGRYAIEIRYLDALPFKPKFLIGKVFDEVPAGEDDIGIHFHVHFAAAHFDLAIGHE